MKWAPWFWPMALPLVGAVHQLEVKSSGGLGAPCEFSFHTPTSPRFQVCKRRRSSTFSRTTTKKLSILTLANKLVWKIQIFLDEMIWIWPNYNKSPTYISLKKGGFHGFPFLSYMYNRYTLTRWISATLATVLFSKQLGILKPVPMIFTSSDKDIPTFKP